MKRYLAFFVIIFAIIMPITSSYAAEAGQDAPKELQNKLIALTSDALIGAGDKDWSSASAAVDGIKEVWAGLADDSAEAKGVAAALSKAEKALDGAQQDPAGAYKAVSALAKAADDFISSESDSGGADIRLEIRNLLPHLQDSLSAVQAGDWDAAKQGYSSFVTAWGKSESAIRSQDVKLYGSIEVKISGVRIALNTEPVNAANAAAKLEDLSTVLNNYAAGKADEAAGGAAVQSGINSISGLITLVDRADKAAANKQAGEAAASMDTFIASWPAVEGVVLTRSQRDYNDIETAMVTVASVLLSNPPDYAKAQGMLGDLRRELEPYDTVSSYSAWDAGAILFREGLEAIMVITALLAMLSRSGNADKRKWIWTGSAAGVIFSGLFAVLLTIFLGNLSTGSSRELIEGVTGLISVLFMVTVGIWLHGKSNLDSWNRFVERAIGASLAKGAMWSLALTAFLAVMREGAETIIFYIGMASSISASDMLLGIGGALAILVVIGFAILKLSARIPVRQFFLLAGLLLYYMAFKFAGVSVHAFQVAGKLPAHVPGYLPDAPSLGIYGSWETSIPQLLLLLFILGTVIRMEWKRMATGRRLKMKDSIRKA